MQLRRIELDGHRSIKLLKFDAGPFTVLFGKNNAGKTNILETIYGLFDPDDTRFIRRTHAERPSNPQGGLYAELDVGIPFDDAVSAAVADSDELFGPLEVAFTDFGVATGDLDPCFDEETGSWHGNRDESLSLHVLFLDWQFKDLHERVQDSIAQLASSDQGPPARRPWLEMVQTTEEPFAYRVPPSTRSRVEQLASLATDLLPDFVDGSVRAHVTAPALWEHMPKVTLEYNQRGLTQCADLVDAAGHGAARWMSAALQIALHLMREYPDLMVLRDLDVPGGFSRHVLLIDEPEAHLHPAAVGSMVRWCQRMVHHGFTVIVASHHEEFLRAREDVTLVHVTRDSDLVRTSARTLLTKRVKELQRLASDVGMHPASVLGLHRAILFVEGSLDEAVLDEYSGALKLEPAGVKIIPIHGTKNLEGLVSVELVSNLGIKMGILTDATDPATMADRSRRKRSSEEQKVLRVLEIAKEKRLPEPRSFGVAEGDLLFAIPTGAIRDYLKGPFPEWKDLVAECREAMGKRSSDSVNWKSFAFDRYGLDIRTPLGVREIVRALDLAGVELPSIQRVIDEVVVWAEEPSTSSTQDTPESDGRSF